MNDTLETIPEEYASALQEYLNGAGEAALQRAYELGRTAITTGLGGLELVRIHQGALESLIRESPSTEESARTIHLASGFFAETLSPLEMIQRGFHDAIETLQSSEQRYRTLVDTAQDVIYTLSPEGAISSLNPAFEAITGWPCSEWIGKSFAPLVHPGELSFALEVFQRVLRGETPAVFELRVHRKSGGYVTGEFTTTPQFHNGEVMGILGIARDITDRKRSEEQLRRSEEQFRLIAENVDDLIAVLDTQGRRIYNSPSYERILGDPRALRGTDAFAEIHPDDRERIKAIFEQTVVTGIGRRTEFRFLSMDGSIRYIESQGSVIKNVDGKTEQVIVVSRDVTERKQADRQIKKSQKQLAAAQQIAGIGSWEWVVAENKLVWSDELLRIYGVKAEGFAGTYQAFLQRVHPEDRLMVQSLIGKVFVTKDPFQFEHRIVLSDGSVRIMEARGEVILDGEGKPVGMMGTGQDITDRKKKDEALKALAKRVVGAQEDERRRIARELHDDVCQRLTGVRFTLDDLTEEIAPRQRGARNRLRDAISHIDELITEVRRMSSNLRPSSLDDFGLAIAMRRLCEQHQKIHKTKVAFCKSSAVPDHYDPEIEIALYRIAQEALSNISKHASAKRVTVTLSQDESVVALDILDNGKGFLPQEAETRKSSDQGMGLVSMSERAKLAGGSFRIESFKRKGTAIHVEIQHLKVRHEENKNPDRRRP